MIRIIDARLGIDLKYLSKDRHTMQDTGCSGLVHWDDPEGWHGEGGGSGIQDGEHVVYLWQIHVDVWQNQYNIVK